ncbi:MAG: Rpn family recombination-promoting nuclease/putative transposase, partial [Prevotellaceae bacterium]|nr:Rpn family recombination-promoting nuclease/putative transposase [Prevotellaceae bacterium]
GKSRTKAPENVEEPVFINIKTDFGFKKIFGNKALLIAFLNAILNKDIVEIEYLPTEQLGYIRENRKAVYDVYCTTTNGEQFIVEMQASPQLYLIERILFYMGYPVINQAPKGKVTITNNEGKQIEVPWNYSISGIYMICILDGIIFPEEEAKDIVVEQMKILRQRANKVFTDKWQVVTIELPKFNKTENELKTVEDKWLYSFKNMEKLPKCPKNLNENIFNELYENARIINLTKREMKAYSKSVLEYDDVILAVERGRIEGENKERIKIVRNCYKNGISIEQIAKITGVAKQEVTAILTKS